jgi:hypothetical protein
VGKGGDGFNITNPPNGPVSSGVGLDPEGALVVNYANNTGQNLIWVPHTGTDMVSKIDTTTMKELARYRVGARDPSRTSVAPNGNAYVSSREGVGMTKISAMGQKCPDTNGDGVITTSTGPNNVLPYGQDDCVLWFRDLKPYEPNQRHEMIRGAAVQMVPGRIVTEKLADGAAGPPKVTWVPPREYVWTGGTEGRILHKLDGDTGEVVFSLELPIKIYGLAMDGRDRVEMGGPYLWITGGSPMGHLAHVDTSRCLDIASCTSTPVCTVQCSEKECKNTCDDAIVSYYSLNPANAYGITVDCKQRIWLGSATQGHANSDIKRYDPYAPSDQRLKRVAGTLETNGIAADGEGFVWGAFHRQNIVYKIHGETLKTVNLKVPTKGFGVARDGRIWSIANDESNELHVIEPTKDLSGTDKILRAVVTLTGNPYVYSDVTGQQLLLANNEPGVYRQVFDPCVEEDLDTLWRTVQWDADLPKRTNVIISLRTADTRAALTTAAWVTIAVTEANLVGSQTLEGILEKMGRAKYIEVQAQLFAEAGRPKGDTCYVSAESGASPRVKKLGVAKACVPKPPAPIY